MKEQRMSLDELIERRAELMKELDAVNGAIELLGKGASAVRIRTRKNIKNSRLAGITVYSDEKLTKVAPISDAGGFISSASLAHLRLEVGYDEDEMWWVEEV